MIYKWLLQAFFLSTIVIACSHTQKTPLWSASHDAVEFDVLAQIPKAEVSFSKDVQPILKSRCAVCHGCYDAPCQLKLTSYEGVARGVSNEKVYDGTRIQASRPSRLFIDAKNTSDWRKRGFSPIINESSNLSKKENLSQSVLYQILRLKQTHPQPRSGSLSEDIDTSLDREQICSQSEDFTNFAEDHPSWGMPFAFPNLSNQEYRTLVNWIAQGAKPPNKTTPSKTTKNLLHYWEDFLNGSSLKQRLVSRYIYEHLFLSHIHFKNTAKNEFYRLVRSTTSSGETIEEIPTVRPYDDPKQPFYYRFQLYHSTIVAKDHIVYELSKDKMARYKELFYKPKYKVEYWPPYHPYIASNPFKTFNQLPVKSRYLFLLDDAKFYIEGFVKGPVCRGQVALNVIEDQFWVFFFDPDHELSSTSPELLAQSENDLQLPAAQESEFNLLSIWSDYWEKQAKYLNHKSNYFKQLHSKDLKHAIEYLWNGDNKNPNAALTIFRHFDSASVRYGLVGDYPETAWVLDYPLLERIHYLLVAGFNVHGNVSHQLNTRLYMDFLRMEAEDQFLNYIPVKQRKKLRESWYSGIRANIQLIFETPRKWLNISSAVISDTSKNPQLELFRHIESYLKPILKGKDLLNRCYSSPCINNPHPLEARADEAMRDISKVKGEKLSVLPDVSFLRIKSNNGKNDLAYTLLHNKAYKSVSFMLSDESVREPLDQAKDTLSVVKGLESSYPNFFLVVPEDEINDFVKDFTNIAGYKSYQYIIHKYGIHRTNPDFWIHSDWFLKYAEETSPLEAGVFDLNRYYNY